MNFRQPFLGDYPITQKYGEIVPGITKNNKPHTGIDYWCPAGTKILASAGGEVMFAGWEPTGYGYCVIVWHSADRSTLYAHLEGPTVRIGQKVQQGDVIGISGSTGYATGPHLHFEARRIWNNYQTHFDPMQLPLMNFADFAEKNDDISEVTSQKHEKTSQKLKEPSELGSLVEVICPDGAKVFNPDWSMLWAGFPQGTKLHFTGKTAQRPGFPYTYCEVYEEPRKYYVAVHNGTVQILDNAEKFEEPEA